MSDIEDMLATHSFGLASLSEVRTITFDLFLVDEGYGLLLLGFDIGQTELDFVV